MGVLDPTDDHDPFAWLCGGEPPSGVPELLDPAETPVTFALARGALTGSRLSPDRDPADRQGAPRDRFALDDAELSCIARTLLLDDGVEGLSAEAGAARGHDEDRRKARRLFRSVCVSTPSQTAEHPWLGLFDDDRTDACFTRMAEVKERALRTTTGFPKRRVDAAERGASGDTTEDAAVSSSLRANEPSSPSRRRAKGRPEKPARNPNAPVSNKPVSSTSTPPPGRSSRFRGVTKHRWTGRYEAHLWDSSFERNAGGAAKAKPTSPAAATPQATPSATNAAAGETPERERKKTKGRAKGKQVYLGGYAREEEAARAYDKAAIKYWGANANLNFPRSDYVTCESEIANTATAQLVAQLRRGSTGFSRGASRFRGVTRHHQHGRWEARIGRVLGNRYLYLGTFASEEEAARAYDVAALRHRGPKAVTNFARESYASGCATLGDDTERTVSDASRRETAVLGSAVRGVCAGAGAARAGSDSGSLAFDAFEEPLEGEVIARRD